jgi:general secretion pathway protein D
MTQIASATTVLMALAAGAITADRDASASPLQSGRPQPNAQPDVPPAAPAATPPASEPSAQAGEPAEPAPAPQADPSADSPAAPAPQAPSEAPASDPQSPASGGAIEPAPKPLPTPILIDAPGQGFGGVTREFRTDRRRVDPNDLVLVNFREIKAEDLFTFIMECTGKPVIPRLAQIRQVVISVISDKPVSRAKALELIMQAFRLNDIAVVETDDLVMIDMMDNAAKLQPARVLGPEVDVLRMEENGQVVIKIFKVVNTRASGIFDRLSASLPAYAKIDVDPNSNQIILEGDVGLAKRCAEIIGQLDVPPYVDTRTDTFRLQYADASVIADAITTIFTGSRSSAGGAGQPRQPRAQRPGQPAQPGQPGGGGGEVADLVVTVLPATNSITVRSDQDTLVRIRELISRSWDIPPTRHGSIFKAYDLVYTDPIKVRTLLQELLQSGSSGGRTGRGGAPRLAGGGGAAGGGGESSADVAVANIFKIEAYPDSNRLVVVTKTPDNFEWLDVLVAEIDQPLEVGLPRTVPLKYASAIELAEIINALLAQSGAGTGITAPEEGLSGLDFASSGTQSQQSNALTGQTTGGAPAGGVSRQTIEFPWQQARGGEEEQNEVSALVGKSRVVPNAGQNSLLVLAAPEIQQAILDMIDDLDRPGRQVMINAILAEVELGDKFAMGIQWGQYGAISPADPANAVVIGDPNAPDSPLNFSGGKDGLFVPPFTTPGAFNFGVDATVILQALQQDTSVRILQQPRVCTTDNKEAIFFNGQDVPFLASTGFGANTGGGQVSAFEQISVGIGLNVRPRITKEKNVAMDIQVLYSNLASGVTVNPGGSGNPTVTRRQTNTTVTIKNGQTVVIGGIRLETQDFKKQGFPILGDIPILDLIFGYQQDLKIVKELVIFITPTVIENPDENDSNFNVLERQRLEALSKPLSQTSKDLVEQGRILGKDGVDPIAPITPNMGAGRASGGAATGADAGTSAAPASEPAPSEPAPSGSPAP